MTYLLLLIRIGILFPLTVLTLRQAIGIIIHWNNLNGLKKARIALFVLTLAFELESLEYFIGDIHAILLPVSFYQWYESASPIFLVIRAFMLLAIWHFYRLYWGKKE